MTKLSWIATVAQVTDLATFPFAVAIWGISGESNLMMGWVYATGGVAAVAVVKLMGAGIALRMAGCLTSWRLRLGLGFIAGFGVLGALTNVTAILVS